MANRQKGETRLTVGGREYTLRLTTDAAAQLEDAVSEMLKREVFFPEILARVGKGSVKTTRLFIWAALLHHHPAMTQDEARRIIDDAGGVEGFANQVQAVAASTMPDEDAPADPPAAQATPAGTGDGSTSSPVKSA